MQEPGRSEAEFARIGTSMVIKKFLTYHDPRPVLVPKEMGFAAPPDKEMTLPSWLSEEDINYFASKFDKSGFTGGLNYYRALDLYVCSKIFLLFIFIIFRVQILVLFSGVRIVNLSVTQRFYAEAIIQ